MLVFARHVSILNNECPSKFLIHCGAQGEPVKPPLASAASPRRTVRPSRRVARRTPHQIQHRPRRHRRRIAALSRHQLRHLAQAF